MTAAPQLALFEDRDPPPGRAPARRRLRVAIRPEKTAAAWVRISAWADEEIAAVTAQRLDGLPLAITHTVRRDRGRVLVALTADTGHAGRSFRAETCERVVRAAIRQELRSLTASKRRWNWERDQAMFAIRDALPSPWGRLDRSLVLDEHVDQAVASFQELASHGYICECAAGQFGDLPLGGIAARWLRGIESGELVEAEVLAIGGRLLRSVCELEANIGRRSR